MPTYIALLRGINVSGQKKIRMADLKELMEGLGFSQVTTYIQSGNIVFESSSPEMSQIESTITDGIRDKYGFEVTVIVLTPRLLEEAIENNPFLQDPDKDIGRLYLTLLDRLPSKELFDKVRELDYRPEEFVLKGKSLYFYSPHGYGRAKMNNNFFEQKLKVRATTRNWKTVNILLDMSRP